MLDKDGNRVLRYREGETILIKSPSGKRLLALRLEAYPRSQRHHATIGHSSKIIVDLRRES